MNGVAVDAAEETGPGAGHPCAGNKAGDIMKVYLIHHTTAFSLEQDPERHLTELGRAQADRLGTRFAAAGIDPVRILHSDKQWVRETAERIGAVMGLSDRLAVAGYPIASIGIRVIFIRVRTAAHTATVQSTDIQYAGRCRLIRYGIRL